MAKPFFNVLFTIFMVFYYGPFLSTLFFENRYIEFSIYILGGLTNLIFFGVELIQMKNAGIKNYFRESFWNVMEFSQFFLYIYYVFIRVKGDWPEWFNSNEVGMTIGHKNAQTKEGTLVENKTKFYEALVTMALVCLGFTKVLYFIRIFEDFGLLVQVIGETITEIIPFAVYYIIWILFFSGLFLVL